MPGTLVSGNRHSDARAADKDAAVELARCDWLRDARCIVRIVDRHVGRRSKVLKGKPVPFKRLSHVRLELDTCVIGAQRNSHSAIVL